MSTWKDNIGKIRFILTSEPSVTYDDDIINTARFFGYAPQMWKDALQQWGQNVGAESGSTWKDDFVNIAFKLTGITPVSWKTAIEYIRIYYEGYTPALLTLSCFTSLPYNPNAEYLLLSDKYITQNSYLLR